MTEPTPPTGSPEPVAPPSPAVPSPQAVTETIPGMTPVARVEEVSAPLTKPVRGRGGRARWLVALVATLVVVIVAGVIIVVAGSTGSQAVAPAYLPADTLLYADARLDMPGDQRDQVAALLAKFPGFADQASLEAKLDDALDRLVKNASSGQYTYTGNVKPWFGGQIGLGAWSGGSGSSQPASLLVLSVADRSKLPTQLDQASQDLAKQLGVPVSVEDHGGVSIITLGGATGSSPSASGLANLSFAITDDAIVAAKDAQGVAAALDRKAGKAANLAGAAGFQKALASLERDRLGTLYVDGSGLGKLVAAAIPSPSGATGSALVTLPGTLAGELRVESGNVVARGHLTPAAGASATPAATPTTSTLAQHVPGDAAFYAEMHDVATAWNRLITQLKAQPGYTQLAPQLETLEGLLGSKLDAYFDWTRDLGAVVTLRDGKPEGGLVITASNAAAGEARLKQLVTLLRLAGASGITVTDQAYKGTTITTLTLDLGALARLGGGGSILPLPSGFPTLPNVTAAPDGGAATLPSGRVQLSYAFSGDTFVLGVGDDFVKQVLDVTASTSLAAQARYTDALAAAGGPTSLGNAYADITAWRTFLEAQLPTAEKAKYESDVKPYLTPFDRVIALATRDGEAWVGSLIVFTTK
jgi:Protein of unknown function (DUF3352)